MRKTTLILLLFLSGLVHAQTDLSGRIYANPNVMSADMEKDMALLEHKIDSMRKNGYAEFEQKKGRKPTAEEKAEIEEKMKEARKMMESLKKDMAKVVLPDPGQAALRVNIADVLRFFGWKSKRERKKKRVEKIIKELDAKPLEEEE
jgi:predicted TIM-barrel fold metal-dependent hydrolase